MSAPRRIRLTVEYDGGGYSGWQRQRNAVSVQQRLEEALFRITGERAAITGASRTDAGVHALSQVAHFDTLSRIPADKFSYALNTKLPPDIRVRASAEADESFHARFDAKAKVYRYLIYDGAHHTALLRGFAAHSIYPLDDLRMDAEARAIEGKHDFAAFAASGSAAKDTVRTVYRARVRRRERVVALFVLGDGFLYNMVRILAGTLMGVGSGKLAGGAIPRALSSGNRLDLGTTAPACGLTLLRVFYGDDFACAGAYFDGRLDADWMMI